MRPRVLQIFNRYLEYGGEEGSVYRIGNTLQEIADVEYFTSSSKDFLGTEPLEKLRAPLLALHNPDLIQRLERYQAIGHFQIWQIHNIFPSMSPSVYTSAFRAGIPIVQYLHNYRMSCVNGYFLNHGKTCVSCIHGNFLKAAMTGCWHDSRSMSGWMGLVLTRLRAVGVFSKVSAWIALSKAQKSLHVKMGIPEKRITILPHFFSVDPVKRLSGFGKDVLFVGRLSKEKGVHELLDAWKLIPPSKSYLLLMGDGPERDALKARISAENIPNVVFLGFIEKEMQEGIWARTMFSVVPSIWQDPLPTVVFEAWERSRTVIVSAAGGLDDTVEDGVDGLKFEMGNAQQFAEAMTTLLKNHGLAAQLAENGLKKLQTNFSRDVWLDKISGLYKTILV